ncbi:MAG: tellurium resistance protein [Pseudomonadota bacterium]
MAAWQGLSDWRRFPPAVFGAVFGLAGLSLLWLNVGPSLGLGQWLGWAFALIVLGVYSVFLVAYARKFMQRPAVFIEDIDTIPGRLGAATMVLIPMLMSAALAPVSPAVATFLVFLTLTFQAILAVIVVQRLLRGGGERRVTPVWHLVFVGFVVGTQASALLGYHTLATLILGATLFIALGVYGASLDAARRANLPPPLRGLHVIHLAPFSLFGTTAMMLGLGATAVVFAVMATGIALFLLARLRWMIEAGFSPAWGAFTFPVVAYTGLIRMVADLWPALNLVAWGLVAIVTLYVPVLAARLILMCLDGRMAEATKAARA